MRSDAKLSQPSLLFHVEQVPRQGRMGAESSNRRTLGFEWGVGTRPGW